MHNSPREAITALLGRLSVTDAADSLDVNVTHVYRARRGDYTPTMLKALRRLELIPEMKRRIRYHFTLSEADEREFLAWREKYALNERLMGDAVMLWVVDR